MSFTVHDFADHGAALLAARGVATLALVAITLVVLRNGGQVLAGLVAAIPVTSAPALAWVGADHGAPYAAQASLAALYATALTALFAAAYALLARHCGRLASLLLAVLAVVVVAVATRGVTTGGPAVLAFTVLAFGVAYRALPAVATVPARKAATRSDVAFTAAVSGVLTIVVSAVAQNVPAQWCGLIAAIPVVGMTTIVLVHGRWPLGNLRAFLRAYAHGLVAKAAFVGTLAATLVPFGLAGGWAAAIAAGAAVLLGRHAIESLQRDARPAGRLASSHA